VSRGAREPSALRPARRTGESVLLLARLRALANPCLMRRCATVTCVGLSALPTHRHQQPAAPMGRRGLTREFWTPNFWQTIRL